MKLPFDFGPKLIFRLGIPGMILATATAPLVFAFARTRNIDVDRLEVIAVGTVFWGWATSLADMPIYMLFEGRRFWPKKLKALFLKSEERRLAKISSLNVEETRMRDPRFYMENAIELMNFPIKIEDGSNEVQYPTRLGNLITAYETYPRVNYGLDAIFYWPRLWSVLDKDLREEIDNQQSIADSALYTSSALWISTIFLLGYAIAGLVFRQQLYGVPKPFGLVMMAIGTGLGAFIVYRLSLYAHAQFGELFKAIFDQHRSKLEIDKIVEIIGSHLSDPDAAKRSEAERYQMVVRYLRWHRIRPRSEVRNFSPEEWRAERARRDQATKHLQS